MMICSPLSTCAKNVACLIGSAQKQMSRQAFNVISQPPPGSCCFYSVVKHPKLQYTTVYASEANSCSPATGFQALGDCCFRSNISKQRTNYHSLTFKIIVNPRCCRKTRIDISVGDQNMNLGFLVPKRTKTHRASAGLFVSLLVCFSTSEAARADAPDSKEGEEDDCDGLPDHYSHGKKVHTNYSVIGIPGDGRCMFRSVAHGACIRSGKSAPNESLQKELADELRAMVADEFIKRREETEWFVEGDFDTYVSQMRKPHVWGGEPELLMASHVLRMPITVYMHDKDSGGLISIAEYGQEYGKGNPIKVLYHGFGHYDALHIPDSEEFLFTSY